MVKLTLERGGARESFPLGEEAITIGRSPGNTIVIDDTASSRRHCRIDPVATGFELLDLESQNGTKVNGKTVKRHTLASGDRIEIGTHVFTFTTADDDGVEVEEVEIEGEVDAMAIFLVFEGGPHDADRIDLTVGTHVVGRKKASGVDIAIDDASVSTKHAEIRIAGDEDTALAAGAVTIKDLGSTNGTFKNGARVSEAELRHGDQIRFGSVKLRFSDARSGGDIPEVTILKGDEAEGAKRSMVPSVALLALLLVAGGAAAYFALRPDRSGVKPAGAPPAGSLIRDGWSFEEPESANLWVAERGTASPADGAAKSGAFALRVTAAGSEGSSGRGIATYDPYLAVRAGATYRVSAAVAQSGGSGVGGILVRYYDRSGAHPDEPLWLAGTEFVPLAPGFRAVEALVSAPSSMNVSHARVSCVAFGSGVRALFDDVVFAVSSDDAQARLVPHHHLRDVLHVYRRAVGRRGDDDVADVIQF
ncbi:MAG: FHA domain-containing protein, partial [Planctomycetes bacterium]|nr:FHA domain-containing protein [Planctomycetota bacterium]